MSAAITGAAVALAITASAQHSGPSVAMTQVQAGGLLAMLCVAVVLGLVWVHLRRNDWYDKAHKGTTFFIGFIGGFLLEWCVLGLVALVAIALGY